jgi:bifunctional NMN adenylyltransferase/nudix hydrolase
MLQVIIGRFQTNKLHEGHADLIRQVKSTGNDVLVLIGCTAATGTDKNPLSFEVRKHLFDSHFNNTPILPLHDMLSDKDWSDQIDNIIEGLGYKEAVIWGGRDNSIEGYYTGKHKIKVIEQLGNHSATSIRKAIAKETINCANFRAGIIHHVENRYPIVYSTVDIALINDEGKILMGKKGDKFFLIGGFVDVNDRNLIGSAYRELLEETSIFKIDLDTNLEYFDSFKVDDSRYRKSKDCIMTHLFVGKYNKLPKEENISDKEFSEFRYLGRQDINLVSPTHKYMFELLLIHQIK